METTLVVSSTQKGSDLLAGLLVECGFFPVSSAKDGSEARRLWAENCFDYVVINAPLRDESGVELAYYIVEQFPTTGVLFLVGGEEAEVAEKRLMKADVFLLEKPLRRQFFAQAVKLLRIAHRKLTGLTSQNAKLQDKIEEIKLVDRAKCALIQYLNMTEAQAHRYLEKQAMDMRKSRLEVAEGILRTYES